MSVNIFELVKDTLHPRLESVLPDLLPGGRHTGREYACGSLQGGKGDSCETNLDTGVGSDFATGESWKDIIGLWAAIQGIRQGEAARALAEKYGIRLDDAPQAPRAAPSAVPAVAPAAFPVTPVSDDAPKPPDTHPLCCLKCRHSTVLGTALSGYAPAAPSWWLCLRVCRRSRLRPYRMNFGG